MRFPPADVPCCAGWNCLDFVVVVAGLIELMGLGNYTAIRALRALRPLRAITKIEQLRVSRRVGHVCSSVQQRAESTNTAF